MYYIEHKVTFKAKQDLGRKNITIEIMSEH